MHQFMKKKKKKAFFMNLYNLFTNNKQTTEYLNSFQGKCREGINWNSFVFKIICEASKLCLLASVLQLWGLELFIFLITFLIPLSKYWILCIYGVGK